MQNKLLLNCNYKYDFVLKSMFKSSIYKLKYTVSQKYMCVLKYEGE